jgi:predicted nucleic acid-binding Zn ribbon protein
MAFILKGGGWYKDGYSSQKKNESVDREEAPVTPDR